MNRGGGSEAGTTVAQVQEGMAAAAGTLQLALDRLEPLLEEAEAGAGDDAALETLAAMLEEVMATCLRPGVRRLEEGAELEVVELRRRRTSYRHNVALLMASLAALPREYVWRALPEALELSAAEVVDGLRTLTALVEERGAREPD